jgi:putative lipase involved disintegration of autophagic bodies
MHKRLGKTRAKFGFFDDGLRISVYTEEVEILTAIKDFQKGIYEVQ